METLGRYQLRGVIGAGGMGKVYRAWDGQLRREIALKVLPEDRTADAARKELLREARLASGLNHPNIVVVYEVGEADGRGYIAMELVEGQSLLERIGGCAL